jgi:hypothetical protein
VPTPPAPSPTDGRDAPRPLVLRVVDVRAHGRRRHRLGRPLQNRPGPQERQAGAEGLGDLKIEGDQLIIATNTKSEDTRPGEFSTKLSAGPARATNLQTYKLVKPEVAKKPASDVKPTPEEIAAAVDKAMKELQGQWILEKSERNGFSYWVLPEESIYIEKNLLS